MDKTEAVEETELKEPLHPPLPPAPPDRCDYRRKFSWKEDPSGGNYTVYSFENLDGEREAEKAAPTPSTAKEPLYSTTEIVDMLQGLHTEIETLKDRIYCINNRRTSFVYENIEGKRRNSETRRENRDYMLKSAHEAGFHRLRFVLDPQVGCFRKFLWFLLVVCALGLLIFQLLDRVVLFISFPTEVNIQTHYVNSLEFPAVTICNRNPHRLTRLADMGLYEEVLAIYNGQRFDQNRLHSRDRPGPRGNYLDVMRNVSHLKNDFIRRCYWQNDPCNLEEDFRETITDFGICYTFHPRPRHVHGTGPTNGLSLLLNVEQYEYMLGAKSAVGARITVQQPGQVPWMSEKGVDVAVGMYTAMELETVTRRSAPPPHTGCRLANAEYNRDQCITQCQRSFQEKHCHCSMDPKAKKNRPKGSNSDKVHNDKTQSKEPCTISGYIKCRMNVTERWAIQGCYCPPECKNIDYKMFLSYAKLSAYAAESIVKKWQDGDILERKLQKARDTYHQKDSTIYEYDVCKLQTTSTGLDKVNGGIDTYVNQLSINDKEYETTPDKLRDALESLNNTVSRWRPKFHQMTHVAFFSLVRRIETLLDQIEYHQQEDAGLALRGLLDKLTQILSPKDAVNVDSSPILELRDGVKRFQQTIVNGYGQLYREFRKHQKKYNDTTNNMLATTNDLNRLLLSLYSSAKNASTGTSRHLKHILDIIFSDIVQQKEDFVARLNSDHDVLFTAYMTDRDGIMEFARTLSNTSKTFTSTVKRLQHAISDLKPAFERLHTQAQLVATNFTSLRIKYEDRFIRKTEMAKLVNGDDMKEALRSLRASLNETRFLKQDVADASRIMTQSIHPVAYRFTDFGILTETEVYNLLERLKFTELKLQVTKLTEKVENTLREISEYQSELREYLSGSKINGNFYLQNFMQVDIYFKELRETKITQHEAYGLFDFGCDIGGTLALYVGISALTLFEIIDFLCGTILCRGSKKRMEVNL